MYQIFKLTENISFGLIVTYHNAAKSDSEQLAYHVLYIIPLQKLKKNYNFCLPKMINEFSDFDDVSHINNHHHLK